MKKVLLLIIIIGLVPLTGTSQYLISGKISNEEGVALQGAHIVLSDTYKSTISDNDGQYRLADIASGKYLIRISYMGYATIEMELDVNNNIEKDFTMEVKPIMEDEVIITATRAGKKSPTTYVNVNRQEIQEVNFARDLPYIMETTPSTVVSSDAGTGVGYTGIRIRGTDITRINVTINGIPLNDQESQGVFWVNMPDFASSVDNIQIQRGVGSSTNGAAAFGASINIQTTKIETDPYAKINSLAGSFNTFKNNVTFGTGLIGGKWSFDGRLSMIASDGYIDRATANLKSFYISGGYFGETSMLKAVIFSGKEKTYQAWNGVPKDSLETNRTYNPYTYENETDNYQQDHYQLHYSKQFGRNFYGNLSLFYIHGEGYYEQYKEDESCADYMLPDIVIGNDTIASTNLIRQKWLDNDFYGVTYSLKYNTGKLNATLGGAWNKYKGDHFGEVIWAQFASNMKKGYRWYDNTGDKRDFNIFGKAQYQLSNSLSLYGDLQYRNVFFSIDGIHDDLRNITQDHSFSFFNPKAGIYYDLNNHQGVYFSFAVSNREPNRSNYRDADAGHTPEPERLFDYEAGYKLSKAKFGLEANLFYMDYKDQLVMTGEINDVGAAIMTNVPESYRAGIEIMAGLQVFKRLKWNLNGSFSRNKIKEFTEFVDDWSPPYEQIEKDLGTTDLSFSPEIIAGSQIIYTPVKGMNINLISKYVSRQYIDNTSSKDRSLDPYFYSDLVINYSIKMSFLKEIAFHLMVNNIFNAEYETYAWVYRYYHDNNHYEMDGYFPQAGINFMGGVTLSF